MRKAKIYQNVTKRFFRPEMIACLECGTRLRRYAALASRTISHGSTGGKLVPKPVRNRAYS